MMGGPRKERTIELYARDIHVRCTRCGYEAKIADQAQISALSTLLYAFNKMHGPGKCEVKGA